ncbi:MAG: hypothetical protein V2I24_16900 [Halieaceae bacterium]|jgi:hypothetical protein|nr:hypothetical protein [Halieaceae bacterium]
MRWILVLVLLTVLASPVLILLASLESSPRVTAGATLSVADVENAKQLLRDNDPRRLRDGERRLLRLSQRELNLVLSYVLPESAAARATLADGLMTITASFGLPQNPLGTFLNSEMILVQRGDSLEPVAASLGRFQLPAGLASGLGTLWSRVARATVPEYASARDSLRSLRIEGGSLLMEYEWREELLAQVQERGRDLALPESLRTSARVYYETLAAQARNTSLARPLQALFQLADTRSLAGREPALENRAALLALGLALNGRDPAFLYTEGTSPPVHIRGMGSTLRGRKDLAKHFVVSATLTLGGGSRLADAIGVFKELSDSRGGSGFSFPDLLADRAGVVLAQRSTGPDARRIQQVLAEMASEDVFMPPIDALPEGLQDLEFRTRYEDLDTQAYGRVRDEVERRIETLPLYRTL